MKTSVTFSILCFIIFYKGIFAQVWDNDIRLTEYAGTSSLCNNNGHSIAASGNTLHVLFHDERHGNYEIFYKRSTNGGTGWQPETRLTNAVDSSMNPSVAVSGSDVFIVWEDRRYTDYDIFFNRSTDGGTTWLNGIDINNDVYNARRPSISVSGLNVHVVWEDNRNGATDIYYRRSTDGGYSWFPEVRLTNNPSWEYLPSVSASGSIIHVVWEDLRDGGVNAREIYYKRSSDNGATWDYETRLTNDPAQSWFPSITSSGSNVYVAWGDLRDGNSEIYYKRSYYAGSTWQPELRLSYANYTSWGPVICVSGSNIHFVWEDFRDGTNEVYYRRTTNDGASWSNENLISPLANYSVKPSVAVSGTAVHVIWSDWRDGNYEIYYRRNSLANPTGIRNFNSEIPYNFALFQNFPNPFNPSTTINFSVPKLLFVNITVFNTMGKEIVTLVKEKLQPGNYSITWDAGNYSSGVYYYKFTADGFTETKKMILIK